jgi:sporulation protein YlmC with PRC-barrel domain
MSNALKAGLCSVLLAASAPWPSAAQAPEPVALVVVDVHAVALGYRASQLIGRSVSNDRGEVIGKIDDLIISQDKVLFVVIGVGGFLHLGEHLIAVPYNNLVVTKDRILLRGATKEAVGRLPQFRYAH